MVSSGRVEIQGGSQLFSAMPLEATGSIFQTDMDIQGEQLGDQLPGTSDFACLQRFKNVIQ